MLDKVIAYLKPTVDETGETHVSLPRREQIVWKRFAPGLVTCYLIGEGTHFTYVQNKHLTEFAYSEEQFHETALANLGKLAEEKCKVVHKKNMFMLTLDGNLEASLLLVDFLWDSTFRQFATDYVAVVPTRDVIVFCESKSPESVHMLKLMCAKFWETPSPMLVSRHLYARVQNQWQLWD